MKTKLLLVATVSAFFILHSASAQGTLIPPGAPAPTMKTLAQIEPRTDVQKLSGDATNQFIISQPGSYYLSSNVVVSATSVNGISIQASNVTLDLNGFAVISPASDTGCGITTSGFTVANLAVRNGVVTGWGLSGIYAANATGSSFEQLRLIGNGTAGAGAGDGLSVGVGCQITRCTAKGNSAAGFNALGLVAIDHCLAESNTADGITVADGSSVAACTLQLNAGNGIATGAKCRVTDCVITGATLDGIHAGTNTTIRGCTVSECGDDGIEVAAQCRVTDNQCNNNGQLTSFGAGIRLTGVRNHVEANTCMNNDYGFNVVGSYNILIRNVAAKNNTGSTSDNYQIAAFATLYGSIHSLSSSAVEANTLANLSSPF